MNGKYSAAAIKKLVSMEFNKPVKIQLEKKGLLEYKLIAGCKREIFDSMVLAIEKVTSREVAYKINDSAAEGRVDIIGLLSQDEYNRICESGILPALLYSF